MSATTQTPSDAIGADEFDAIVRFYRDYYRDELGEFLQQYPKDRTTFPIAWRDLSTALSSVGPENLDLAASFLADPGAFAGHLDEALRQVDLPVDRELEAATVQVHGLPAEYTHYPGGFSPKDEAGSYRAITGEVSRATDVYAKLLEAAFECEVCATNTYVDQSRGYTEPHECSACERNGPFRVNLDRSTLVDAQTLRLQTPPEVAQGAGEEIDVYVEGDLADTAEVGDRITVSGVIHLEQQSSGKRQTVKFDPYVEGCHIELEETTQTELDISPEERDRINALADGAEGRPIDAAADSLKPEVYGHDQVKRMLVLAMVGGAREVADLRGEFHVLLLGDPGTAKTELIDRVEEIAPRAVGVSGMGATVAGVTASAVQDDFGDGNAATLKAGAFVKANDGVVKIDELDDMPSEVRSAMLEPMSSQSIHVSKWGINARLTTRTTVVAAGNPRDGRFEPYEPTYQQFDLESNLLSRFDLIYTFTDQPDAEADGKIADRILTARDAKKRAVAGAELDAEEAATVEGPVAADLLRKWIALAKQQPDPVFADASIKERMREEFQSLRGLYDYDDDQPVPVTFRKLPAVVRIAEAAAKLEFSATIEARHAELATAAVGQSMQEYATDQDGHLDADIQETGTSKQDRDKRRVIGEVITDLQREADGDGAPIEEVIEVAVEAEGFGESQAEHYIQKAREAGAVYEPDQGHLRFVGWGS